MDFKIIFILYRYNFKFYNITRDVLIILIEIF